MSKTVCSHCGDYVNSQSVKVCRSCNTVACDKCAKKNHELCHNCYDNMNFIN